jgi:5'-nucleotidase
MRHKVFVLGLAVLLFAGISSSAIATELVILHTNDTHSNLFPFGPHDQYGGIARMSTLIKKLRSENQNVVALHAGDAFVGTFAFNKYLGYPELKIMEGLYDAMALGNHEFDLGPVVLGYILAGFNPINMQPLGEPVTLPILAAHVDVGSLPALGAFVQPWTIKEIGGMKVGLLGVVTENPVYYPPDFVGICGEPYTAAYVAAKELREQPGCCDVVIALSHLGLVLDVLGLSEVPGIDVIVSSHSHDEFFAPNINGKVIVQAGAFGKNLGELRITIDDATKAITGASHVLHPITEKIHKDPALLRYLNALREGIYADPRYGPVYSQHVAKALWDLEETWLESDPHRQPSHRDTPLGNVVADAIRKGVAKAGYPVDLALEANGYIGHKIYEGKVVGNDVMMAVPYGYDPVSGLGFKLKTVLLYGVELLAGLEYTVSMVEYTEDFSLQVSGLK